MGLGLINVGISMVVGVFVGRFLGVGVCIGGGVGSGSKPSQGLILVGLVVVGRG